jgi:hypothetical protein
MSSFSSIKAKVVGGLCLTLAMSALTGCGGSGGANSGAAKDPQDLSRLKEGPSAEDLKAMQAAAKGMGAPPASSASSQASAPR